MGLKFIPMPARLLLGLLGLWLMLSGLVTTLNSVFMAVFVTSHVPHSITNLHPIPHTLSLHWPEISEHLKII